MSGGPLPFGATARYEAGNGGALISGSLLAEAGGFFKLAEGLLKRQMHKLHEPILPG